MREGTTDIRTPVRFLLNLQLQQDEPRYLGADFGVANINQYPILNQREAHKEIEIPFHKSCGGDDLCESKLQVRKFVFKRISLRIQLTSGSEFRISGGGCYSLLL
jgi:hypothetical protein